jgi:transposase-like protein
MEKKEESDLLELQELALKYRTGTKFHLDAAQKRMIVKAYLVNHVPMVQLCEKFNVSRISIYRWIRTFADGKVLENRSQAVSDVKPNPLPMPKMQKSEESAAEELARLRAENKRLAEALKMAEWMNHAKDVMIDEAEKAFNIPIRKKSGAKQ